MWQNQTKNTVDGYIKSGRFKLPLLFWMGMIGFGLLLWALNSFMVFQNQVRITQSAEISVNSLSSFVSDYLDKHKTLIKSVGNHHSDRIINLANGGGYPYDLDEITNEVYTIFPENTEFAIINGNGKLVMGSLLEKVGEDCKQLIQTSIKKRPTTTISIQSHLSPQGHYHFDILYPIQKAGVQAGLWVRLSFQQLEDFIENLNIEDYDLVITTQRFPHELLIGSHHAEIKEPLSFGFVNGEEDSISGIEDVSLAIAPIDGAPWQVRALENHQVTQAFAEKAFMATLGVFAIAFAVIASMILLTRQFQREREKIQQDAEHDVLFNAGPTVLIEKSAERNMFIKYASPNCETLLMHKPKELLGRAYKGWILPKDIEMVRAKLLEAFRQKLTKVELVYRIKTNQNGGFRWIYDLTHIQYNRAQQPTLLRGYITSIHAQKMAEKNATSIIKAIPEAIFVIDLDGLILNLNSAAEKMVGINSNQISGTHFSHWLKDESVQHYERIKQRFLMEGASFDNLSLHFNTLIMQGMDGEEISVEISFNQIEINNKPLLIQVVKDVTLQVNVQHELSRARDEAEALAKARSRFVATISHEIRTPMNGILGMADLLSGTILNAKQQRYLSAIQQSGKTLLQIINEVLDFAKLDEGHIKLLEESFDLKQLINDSLQLVEVSAEQKGLELKVEYEEQLNHYFMGDSLRIKQLLMNLLSNAVKFTEQGYVLVKVTACADERQHNTGVKIQVIDTGIGIAEENQAKLFDSFTQADDSTSRKFGGTGLGLAITKQLVELMKGSVQLESVYGQGTTFSINLPLKPVLQESVTPASSSENTAISSVDDFELDSGEPILHGKQVLVVEDNEINQNVIEAFLQRLGARVDISDNGLQALDYWRLNPDYYDLIIMDCHMPVMDGYEAARMIRQEEALLHKQRAVPIIALSANVVSEDQDKSIQAGMNAFISKPIDRGYFEAVIKEYMTANNTTDKQNSRDV